MLEMVKAIEKASGKKVCRVRVEWMTLSPWLALNALESIAVEQWAQWLY